MNSENNQIGSIAVNDLMLLVRDLPDVMFWTKDLDGKFTAANQAFIKHLGQKSFADMVGKTDFDLQPFHLSKEYVTDDNWVIETGKPVLEKMEPVRENDGTISWFSTSKVPVFDEGGIVLGTMGYTRKMKRAENLFLSMKAMTRTAEYMSLNHTEDLTVERLARMAKLPEDQFKRTFVKLFQATPDDYINKLRIRTACNLLKTTDLSEQEIADKTGFKNQSTLSRQFGKALGLTPLEYRNGKY